VIDPDGRIAKIFRNVKPEGHAQEVEQVLAALSGGARAVR
jgi:peroxiredoxin